MSVKPLTVVTKLGTWMPRRGVNMGLGDDGEGAEILVAGAGDDAIADLAVAVGSGQIKTGAPARSQSA